jgi:hypothetical protein
MKALQRSHDPWWDLEGRGARRVRIRRRLTADLAFAIAVVACGFTAAAWFRELQPVLRQMGIGLG